jgi:hypothetical protein
MKISSRMGKPTRYFTLFLIMDETGQENTKDSMGIYWIYKKSGYSWNGVFSSFDDKLKEKFRNANGKCKFRKDLYNQKTNRSWMWLWSHSNQNGEQREALNFNLTVGQNIKLPTGQTYSARQWQIFLIFHLLKWCTERQLL